MLRAAIAAPAVAATLRPAARRPPRARPGSRVCPCAHLRPWWDRRSPRASRRNAVSTTRAGPWRLRLRRRTLASRRSHSRSCGTPHGCGCVGGARICFATQQGGQRAGPRSL
ncbi:hypothetical protein GSI_04378 [Ganoderma sinense ZZ0214-1]|uniref:Uncharacterized protein n=1 Tax=Ganoderma sinense ZZ0214-1 TaxID=1077348 RepID=A0A2G8SJ01_9APHY|nr:hypothetical protein GSI_04378 [Ganoderma sinense ZZ0214-1]